MTPSISKQSTLKMYKNNSKGEEKKYIFCYYYFLDLFTVERVTIISQSKKFPIKPISSKRYSSKCTHLNTIFFIFIVLFFRCVAY